MDKLEQAKEILKKVHQEHLLGAYENLNEKEKEELLRKVKKSRKICHSADFSVY